MHVYLYLMDNSFFCICSYNTHPLTHDECLQCVAQLRPHRLCSPLPVKIPKILNVFYLKYFQIISTRLKFLAQNTLQKKLLLLHFGSHIDVSVIGMNAESISSPNEVLESAVDHSSNSIRFDVVFHGASSAPKGLIYVLELAKYSPELTFLVPDSKHNIIRNTSLSPPNNISCIPMSWESGLRDAVSSARLVINPSMWSAPIEGALIKSAKYNNNVATVTSKYAYEAEVSFIVNHLRLPRDPLLASNMLREFLIDHP